MLSGITISRNPVASASAALQFNRTIPAALIDSAWFETRGMGGFWEASFTLHGGQIDLQDYLENGLGRHVEFFTPQSGPTPVWEGYINAITLNQPGASQFVTLDDVFNKVWARYLTDDTATSTSRSAVQQDLDSQALYGIQEHVLTAGISSAANANNTALNFLNAKAFIRNNNLELDFSADLTGVPSAVVRCHGYMRTLKWRRYNQTALSGTRGAADLIADVIAAVGQFVAESEIATNATALPREYDTDRDALSVLFDIARNSGSTRHVIGMYEGRKLVYEQAAAATPANVAYQVNVSNNRRVLVAANGQRALNPAEVRPNNWLRVVDLSPVVTLGVSSLAADRRATFLESVRYTTPFGLGINGSKGQQLEQLLAAANFNEVSKL